MKNQIFTSLFFFLINLSFSLVIQGQEKPIYKDENFTVKVPNGVGIERKVTFKLSKKDYDFIKNSNYLKKWKESTFSEPKNKSYLELHKGWDDVVFYIKSELEGSLLILMYTKLKNKKSLDFIDGSKNLIYISDNGGIRISYTFKSQNDLGNYLIKDCVRTIDMENGQVKSVDVIL
jgi:hypothetical protein